MASGKTFEMLSFTRQMNWRDLGERETRPRNRALRGKDRVKTRKSLQRAARA